MPCDSQLHHWEHDHKCYVYLGISSCFPKLQVGLQDCQGTTHQQEKCFAALEAKTSVKLVKVICFITKKTAQSLCHCLY